MPEIPDLIYGALRQHKYLQSNIDQLTQQLKSQRNKQRKSQYLLGIGATFILCGSLFLISNLTPFELCLWLQERCLGCLVGVKPAVIK